MRAWILSAVLLLTACGSNPASYLTLPKQPVVNMEAALEAKTAVRAEAAQVTFTNLTAETVALQYKLFWYDEWGVSVWFNGKESSDWASVRLNARSKQTVGLAPPLSEAVNYRIYLRAGDE